MARNHCHSSPSPLMLTRTPCNSWFTPLYQILLSNYDPPFPSPRHGRDDDVRSSNHLRPQRASCPPSRPRRRSLLGRGRSLRPLSHLYHLPSDICILSSTLPCWPCRWLGCRWVSHWRRFTHVHQVFLQIKRELNDKECIQSCESQ